MENTDSERDLSGQALAEVEPQSSQGLAPTGFGPSRMFLEVDATGDETLWVFRYWRYSMSVTGLDSFFAIQQAQAAWDSWGNDPDCTPEEIASSDAAELREGN